MSVYYRLEVKDGLVSVVEDYNYNNNDNSNYLRDPNNDKYFLRFNREHDAQKYLNEKIKTEHIHPDWLNIEFDQSKLFK